MKSPQLRNLGNICGRDYGRIWIDEDFILWLKHSMIYVLPVLCVVRLIVTDESFLIFRVVWNVILGCLVLVCRNREAGFFLMRRVVVEVHKFRLSIVMLACMLERPNLVTFAKQSFRQQLVREMFIASTHDTSKVSLKISFCECRLGIPNTTLCTWPPRAAKFQC